MRSYISHLACSKTGDIYSASEVHNLSKDGMPLLARYDLEKLKAEQDKDSWYEKLAPGFWRYQALLPVSNPASQISLGEVLTPLIPLQASALMLGGRKGNIIVKDEGRLPTGSFKARGAINNIISQGYKLIHITEPAIWRQNRYFLAAPWTTVGLTEIDSSELDFRISPNPAKEYINVAVDFKSQPSEIVLISEGGYIYFKKDISNVMSGQEFRLDISNMPAGKYLVTVKDEKKYLTPKKLIVF